MNTPIETILTNELKLHDYKGIKLSLTFGDADINDGYSYARINFRADDSKFDFAIDKPVLNFITDALTLNDKKVWSELNHGPNSGLNADMLDGYHYYDYKDRLGNNHYIHMLKTDTKKFVKIATFNPRRIGNAKDFNLDGSSPFAGIFAKSEMNDKIAEFESNLPHNLRNAGNGAFKTTDMVTKGVYNSTFRGSVSLLKKNYATTIDLHIGLFNEPTEISTDGWATMQKYFYVSLHDSFTPFIDENYIEDTNKDPNKTPMFDNPNYIPGGEEVSRLTLSVLENANKIDNMTDKLMRDFNEFSSIENEVISDLISDILSDEIETYHTWPSEDEVSVSKPAPVEIHTRPDIDKSGHVEPINPAKDYIKPEDFNAPKHEGYSYAQYLDIFRLYYIGSKVEIIDGVEVVIHQYDLYMAIDEKSELHIEPMFSSACLVYNFEKPIDESELPKKDFIRAKSIYDDRYAHKLHRHYNYETKITHLIDEIKDVWDNFQNYVVLQQGSANAKKIMMTDNDGKVFAAKDNFERHEDLRRKGARVLVTTINKCIAESEITLDELAQLGGIEANIQQQIHVILEYIKAINQVIEQMKKDYVKRSGDTMTGFLTLHAHPVNAMHASTKLYVDEKVKEVTEELGDFVKKSGDEMTGYLVLHRAPDSDMQAVNKKYVDDMLKEFVKKSGDTMTGFLTLHADPISDMHAVTKRYVDGVISGGGFVKKTGDTMTGNLSMSNCEINLTGDKSMVRFFGNNRDAYMYGGTSATDIGWWDGIRNTGIMVFRNADKAVRFYDKSVIMDGKRLTLDSSAPASPNNGDVWIKTS